jgi:hypothetical protein
MLYIKFTLISILTILKLYRCSIEKTPKTDIGCPRGSSATTADFGNKNIELYIHGTGGTGCPTWKEKTHFPSQVLTDCTGSLGQMESPVSRKRKSERGEQGDRVRRQRQEGKSRVLHRTSRLADSMHYDRLIIIAAGSKLDTTVSR